MKDDSFDCTLIAHLRIFLLFYRLLYCLILPENRLFFGIWKVVEIEMEDGSEVEFAILDEFEMETEKFVLLGEIEGDNINTDPDGMLFMKAIMDESCEEDEVILNVIEDPEKYSAVVDFYAELD